MQEHQAKEDSTHMKHIVEQNSKPSENQQQIFTAKDSNDLLIT